MDNSQIRFFYTVVAIIFIAVLLHGIYADSGPPNPKAPSTCDAQSSLYCP